MKYYTLLPLLAGAVVAQTTHTVTVGGVQPQSTGAATPVLGFAPESIIAAMNDVVEFVFMQKNHTATQSTFADPCVKKADGQDSGFKPNPNGDAGITWAMTVTTTEPIWMYCAQAGHCAKGMVFSVNAATSGDKTFTAYKQLAITQNGTNLVSAPIVSPVAGGAAAASTVVVEATAGNGALGAQATVVAGTGTDANGQACTCSCLCGVNSFPANAAVGAFGGIAGMIGTA